MAKADWDNEEQATAASFNRNQALADAKATATTYSDANTTYSSSSVFYNGYDPTGLTAEGETNATWEKET